MPESLYECMRRHFQRSSLRNTYRPLLASVAKTLSLFDFEVDGSSECRRVRATSDRTPPDIKNQTFLVRPLIEDERNGLCRGPRRGPAETEPPEVGGGF